MKKTLWIAIVGALAASVVAASAQEVLSANAVGYIKKTLPAGAKFVMVTVPLNDMSSTSNLFGRSSIAQEAPQGSMVYFWNTALQLWDSGTKGIKGWQPAQSNKVVLAGEGFFLKGSNAAPADVDVTISGEVPDNPIGEPIVRAIPGSGAFGTLANAYPVDFKFGESSVAKNATSNSMVYFWNEGLQLWDSGTKGIKGWQPAQSNRVVVAGEGFFLKESQNVNAWTNIKPYTWP